MDCCSDNKAGIWKLCLHHQVMFGLLVTMLGISLALNIYCCASKRHTRKRANKEPKRSWGQRRMEENPIYGNIALQCTQTNVTGADINSPNFPSSVRRDQQRVDLFSQECYANLTLKLARSECGPSAPPLPGVDEEKEADNAEVLSTVSDLYASVQTQRGKILDDTDDGVEYANHL